MNFNLFNQTYCYKMEENYGLMLWIYLKVFVRPAISLPLDCGMPVISLVERILQNSPEVMCWLPVHSS